MQTSPDAIIISDIAHSTEANLPLSDNQVVVYDTRLRNWLLAASGGLDYANPLVAKLNDDGEIVRIRTIVGSPYLYTGSLDIRWAVPGDTLTWSSNTITQDALAGSGVDLWADGNELDAFWVDADAITIETAHSSDGGHTWGAASVVATVSGQGADVLLQLCAPADDTLIFTDSTVGEDADGNPLTALYVTLKVSGVWLTPILWDMAGQNLGVEQQVELPDGATYPSNLSGVALSATKLAYSFYSSQFREAFEDGVWIGKVSNLNYGSTDPHLQWNSPEEIFLTVGIDDDNNATQIFTAFPRLQMVGSEYWIVALEASEFVNHQRYHLAIFRSEDGENWSDRDYRQGASNDDQVGAYAYDDTTPFLYTDLIYANLVVTPERTFIIGFDKAFYCASTILVGEDNPDKRYDLTPLIANEYTVNRSASPTAGVADYPLGQVPKVWDDTDIVTAHHGVIIKNLAGYYDTEAEEDVLIEIGEYQLDNISMHTEDGVESGTVQGIDNISLMERYKADKFWEWDGSSQLYLHKFCDVSPFVVIWGNYYTSAAGRLKADTVERGDNFLDNIAALNIDDADGGFLECMFRSEQTWDNVHQGIALQGKNGDNTNFWAVLYNHKNSGKFSLHKAVPTPQGRVKLYRYRQAVQESADYGLAPNTHYFLRVGEWHGHIMAWWSEDRITWNEVLNYTSPASPVNEVLPCRMDWWGLIGIQRTRPSGATGNTAMANVMQDMFSGSNPRMIALHVELDTDPSLLRKVSFAVTQENEDSLPMPDLLVLVVAGDENSPFDATDEDNIIFSGNASALNFSAHDLPQWKGLNSTVNPNRIRFSSGEHVWLAVMPTATLDTGQSYKWASDNTGAYGTNQTMYSDDDGETWNNFGDPNLNFSAYLEVEYLDGRVKYLNMSFASGEKTFTYENLIKQLAAKSGVLGYVTDDFLNNSDLVLGADNIYWQPESFGSLSDFVLDVDVNADNSPYTNNPRVILGSSTTGVGDGDGYIIDFYINEQVINLFGPGNTLLASTTVLAYLSDQFHLRVVKHTYFIYIYINETLCLIHPDFELFDVVGYVGVDSIGATWTNLRIPDLYQIVEYWAMQTNESAMGSIQKLIAKPAPGTVARVKMFANYAGDLRFGSFSRQVQVDTYEDTMFDADKSETARYTLSEEEASGNYYAKRFRPRVLSTDGRWFDQRDVTDGSSDANAYQASELQFVDAEEKQQTHSIEGLANYAAELEDVVQVINPLDDTDALMAINDITWTIGKDQAVQRIGLRGVIDGA